ncbi:MAG: AAA family ATPase, partial [Saprospiraceae bacterium]|nr:AAA family ATPase [Saprospiraceae bacterium]
MYAAYFALTEPPFSISPDPRYLYTSARHQEAMAHLMYGVREGGGFVQLTGEVGTGKTTLCRWLLDQVPDDLDVALILNPQFTENELLATICDELRIRYPANATTKKLLDLLNKRLLSSYAKGRRTVLIIDEAQMLSKTLLEQVRLLTNLETEKQKLLQIILIGQPELNATLERDDLKQLSQRVTARYHLRPLLADETREYIAYRLAIAGGRPDLFTPQAKKMIHRYAQGVPRLINVICDRALLGAYSQGRNKINTDTVRNAANEVLGLNARFKQHAGWYALAASLLLGAGFLMWYQLARAPTGADSTIAATAVLAPNINTDAAEQPVSTPSADTSVAEQPVESTPSADTSVA